MAATAVENNVPVASESKSARKKKAKADATAPNGTDHVVPAIPELTAKDDSTVADTDASSDHPYLKELQKQVRNISKKLTAMHKLDSVLAEHPDVSLDELVAQRKINQDQKAAALKKPQLQGQLAELEERQEQYRKFDADYQSKLSKQRDDLTTQHQQELEKIRAEVRAESVGTSASELRTKLLIFSQFLRAAAAKRTVEEEADTDESRAFEGALLLVYGGDHKAVDTAINLIDGSDEHVPTIEGIPLPVTYAQVKQASLEHGPFQAEEAWVDQVVEATGSEAPAPPGEVPADSDPTIAHAGLTELEALPPPPSNGIAAEPEAIPASAVSAGEGGNVASERWDVDAAGVSVGAERGGLEESYEIIPRPSEEVDVPVPTTTTAAPTTSAVTQLPQTTTTSWADEPSPPTYDSVVGASTARQENGWTDGAVDAATASAAGAPADDGFHEVPGRHQHRGRGGRGGRGGDGDFRGRGGRGGPFRGPRGDRRGGFNRGRGDGEFRGGRGRGGGGGGRGGPRGGGPAPVAGDAGGLPAPRS